MKLTIALTDTNRFAGPVVIFNGFRGAHRFVWSEPHRAHILDGKELTAEEFNKVAPDIFTAEPERNYFHAVPGAVEERSLPVAALQKPAPRKICPKVYDGITVPTNTKENPVVRIHAPEEALC